jgi:hypothetical protein
MLPGIYPGLFLVCFACASKIIIINTYRRESEKDRDSKTGEPDLPKFKNILPTFERRLVL